MRDRTVTCTRALKKLLIVMLVVRRYLICEIPLGADLSLLRISVLTE